MLMFFAGCAPKKSVSRIACAASLLTVAALFLALPLRAHHGPPVAPLYNTESLLELDGEIVEIFWRNPHVRFRIRVSEGEVWELETEPVGMLARRGIGPELLRIGENVRVAGRVSNRRPNEMALFNLLLPNGEEFTGTAGNRELRFSEQRVDIAREEMAVTTVSGAEQRATGIFRVWARGVREFGGGAEPDNDESVLTETARAARADFDPLTDEPILECVPDGMPRAMLHPTPIEFVDEGEQIVVRIHEHDLVRTIHMAPTGNAVEQPATPLGYSVGDWDGGTLVVTTTRVNWPLSDEVGTPQTNAVELIERFTVTEDQSRLDYELTATDPAVLLRPSVRTAHWMWVAGVEIEPFECALWEGTEE
jgi:hypothetical protein